MIKRIDSIVNFGIFKDYNWTNIPNIEDFKEKNIFYGWNYSGKTTLSRIFSSLRDRQIHPDYQNGNFRVSYDSELCDKTSLSSFPYSVEVFNSDYIKENLKWGYDENINAIYFEVGDNAKITEKINAITILINEINGTDKIKGKKENLQKAINDFNLFEDLYTSEARNIKNDSFLSLIEFNKGHLKKIKDYVLVNMDIHIIKSKDELQRISKVVKIKEPKNKLDEVIFNSEFERIITLTKEALNFVPIKSEIIDILDKKKNAYEWVKVGMSIHLRGEKCIFCDNKIENERYDLLYRYFENQASKLKERIAYIYNLIESEETLISKINLPSSVNDLNDGFQTEFNRSKAIIEREIRNYKKILKNIKNLLDKKASENLYSVIETNYSENAIKSLLNSISNVNDIITHNNKFVEDFDTIIEKERIKYKNHLVATFLKNNKFLNKKDKALKAEEQIKKFNKKIEEYQRDISRLNAKKESDAEGCAQFNSFVQSFLSRDDIKITLNPTTRKFNLMRGNDLAQNLSEGEKMAISFSYFLVYLKSIEKKDTLKDYIVFIDDPISSLDSNHIFQINSLLKDTFFHKVNNPANSLQLKWALKCKQLFISTHNFEFFSLLKDLPKQKGHNSESRYFISRYLLESSIERLPQVYFSSSSEYHYLFGEILNFYNEPNKGLYSKILLLPNILRRFVEMYTLTKYPSHDEEVDTRAEVVFGKRESKRILKLLHHFSHFNSIDRINKHSEFVADIEYACNDLINHIKTKDKIHYDALAASLT